jgi:uncharacterized membrane protein
MKNQKNRVERFCQALGFELGALLLITPLFAWVMGTTLWEMGALTLANSVLALVWNVLFNTGFDRMLAHKGWRKTVWLRCAHAIGFEGVLMATGLPLTMWWLHIGFWPAFAFESGVLFWFVPYTYVYHWVYDLLRDAWMAHRQTANIRLQ